MIRNNSQIPTGHELDNFEMIFSAFCGFCPTASLELVCRTNKNYKMSNYWIVSYLTSFQGPSLILVTFHEENKERRIDSKLRYVKIDINRFVMNWSRMLKRRLYGYEHLAFYQVLMSPFPRRIISIRYWKIGWTIPVKATTTVD